MGREKGGNERVEHEWNSRVWYGTAQGQDVWKGEGVAGEYDNGEGG